MSNIKPSELSQKIQRYLMRWCEDIVDGIDEDLTDISKDAQEQLKRKSPKRTGEYSKGWSVSKGKNKRILYNKDHYRRVHLLENGHLARNGRRVRGQKHVEPVENWAVEELTKRIEARIDGS